MKITPCTEQKSYAFNNAPRCGARTRRNSACQSPVIKGKARCRMHGCAKGSGAAKGNTYAVTHGQSTAENKSFRKAIRQLIKEARDLQDNFNL